MYQYEFGFDNNFSNESKKRYHSIVDERELNNQGRRQWIEIAHAMLIAV
jgi:hypothetical protein